MNNNLFKRVYTKPYNNKQINKCNLTIPANIFQTWCSKLLTPLMLQNINNIKQNNPNFKYFLFDDNDCREFIKNNFKPDVLYAYDSLIPGAYKADLWRYCVLFIHGGIYMDIKYNLINGFKLYNLLEKEHFALDINKDNIYNAIMVCKAGNQILFKSIRKIVDNVKNKYYGEGFLSPTGPALIAPFFSAEEKLKFDIQHVLYGVNDYDKILRYCGHDILRCYPGYFKDRAIMYKLIKSKHYADLWNERKIYL